jgi:hypothetical protein
MVAKINKGKNGNKTYCNIEGVSWVANNLLVVVSDAKKKTQPDECQEKDLRDCNESKR